VKLVEERELARTRLGIGAVPLGGVATHDDGLPGAVRSLEVHQIDACRNATAQWPGPQNASARYEAVDQALQRLSGQPAPRPARRLRHGAYCHTRYWKGVPAGRGCRRGTNAESRLGSSLLLTSFALALVLGAAVVHAAWDLIAKRADDKLPFLWCSALVSVVLFSPLGGWLAATQPVPPLGWVIVALSALLEAAYFWALAQAYRYGELSLVYPIARATAPPVVAVLAAVLLAERPSPTTVGGIFVVVSGVVLLLLPALDGAGIRTLAYAVRGRGTRYALLTGAIIATYSILDKRGVAVVSPPLYAYLLFVGLSLALTPLMLAQPAVLQRQWRCYRGAILAVGVLAPLAYGLVLLALTITPVSSIAAAREVSVVIAAALGALVLREPYGGRRIVASAWIAVGLGLLVLG
jgi:drug/metabolite transporter (DMT)-like permease